MRIAIIRLLGQPPLERAVFYFNAQEKSGNYAGLLFSQVLL